MTNSVAPTGLVVHNVYFALVDRAPDAAAQLLAACRKYLAAHPGIVWFGCGQLAQELKRDVNDRDWDVGLHIVFRDQAAHDAYQVSADHNAFIAENKANWRRVRVFDTISS